MITETVLIVGAGLAGSRCAETLRASGFDGKVVLVGDEPVAPYERPALSKEFLAGSRTDEELLLRPVSYLGERGITLLTGRRVARVDPHRRVAALSDGYELAWDALVLATGARPRRLPGASPEGVHTLRTLADASALRRDIRPGGRLAIVGGGLIGGEVASTARSLGAEVTLIDAGPPLERALGAEVAAILAERYAAHGVDLRLGEHAVGFRADESGRLRAVVLAGGAELPCDTALVAIGARPAAELLHELAAPDGGVATDAAGRTALPDVYACGDVASPWRSWLGDRLRVEHWTEAATRGAAVARAIVSGDVTPPDDLPYFWSDQFRLRLQFVGHAPSPSRVELEGDEESFVARYLASYDRTSAVLLVNRPGEIAAARRELAHREPIAA